MSKFLEPLDLRKVREFLLSLEDHKRREVPRVDWWVTNTLNEERNTTNVVEVTVGNNESTDFVFVFLEVLCIRKNVVDSGCIIF